MSNLFTEDTYEQAIIELFENMGYDHLYAPDFDRDYTSPLLDSILRDSLVRINRGLPVEAVDEALAKLKNFDTGSLLQKNMIFMDYLQNGITVKFFVKGEEQSSIVRLIDYANAKNNSFYVVNQFTFLENGNNRRPDIILFINGLPLVLMELKSPAKDEVGAENAYHQIRNYMQDIPSIFYYNAICVISDLSMNKAGTITSGLDRFMEWKTKDGNYEDTAYASFETFYEGMFLKERLLDILKNFILFSGVSNSRFKVLAGYHQYFAVRKAIEKAKVATKTDGKGGVFWHTQGSGKSLSMVFYAHLLQDALDSPTIVVMTDRIDLDDQLYAQFSQCADFLRQTPVQAESPVKEIKLQKFAEKLIGGKNYSFLQKKGLSLKEIEEYPLICLGKGTMTHQFYQEIFGRYGLKLNPDVEVATTDQILSLVQYGLGIAFIPEPMAEEAVMRQEVVSITVREHIPDREICMVYDEKRPMSVAAQRFKKLLMEEGKQETSANKKS